MKTFEVTIYNKDVRDLVQLGESHHQYDDGWADQRFIQIDAQDADQARKIIQGRHPAHKGFIIVDVMELPDFD